MELKAFTDLVPNFGSLKHPDKILHFGWYLHTHRAKEYFDQPEIRACYKGLSMQEPNFSEQFARLVDKRPRVLLKETAGYGLEHGVQRPVPELTAGLFLL